MCAPVAAVAAVAAGVMSAAGTLVQGMSAQQQGNYESAVAKQNARLEIEAARESEKTGYQERRKFWREVGQTKGQQIASMAANGIDVDYGTAGRIQDDTRLLSNEDAENLYGNIRQRTRGHLINAGNFQQEAKAAKRRGRAAMTASVFGAAGSLLGGISQMQGMKAKLGGGG